MPHRTFRDADGVEWQVWNVVPHVLQEGTERRVRVRRGDPPAPHDPERRELVERRERDDRRTRLRMQLSPSLKGGWLVFEAGTEKRRITPIPADWDSFTDEELDHLRQRAAPVPRRS